MAVTYFAIDGGANVNSAGEPVAGYRKSLDIPDALLAKLRGSVHVWSNAVPPVASNKWIVIGDDIVLADSARLRSISTQLKNRIVNYVATVMGASKADLAQYGSSLKRSFHADIQVPQADVDAL
jgi:hypothetical protein